MANKIGKRERAAERRKALVLKSFDPVKEAQGRVEARGDADAKAHERAVVVPKRRQSAIDRYFDRGSIDGIHKTAADRLLADFHASGYHQRVVASYEPSIGHGSDHGPPLGPKATEFSNALKAVGFPLTLVLWAVVIEDHSAADWAASIGRPVNDGGPALRLALDALANHYKFQSKQAQPPAASRFGFGNAVNVVDDDRAIPRG